MEDSSNHCCHTFLFDCAASKVMTWGSAADESQMQGGSSTNMPTATMCRSPHRHATSTITVAIPDPAQALKMAIASIFPPACGDIGPIEAGTTSKMFG
jgi:hypothetical protein